MPLARVHRTGRDLLDAVRTHGSPAMVDLEVFVGSPDVVRSLFSSHTAAVIVVEVLSALGAGTITTCGTLVLGDLLRLETEGVAIELVARRASFVRLAPVAEPVPLDVLPPELLPLASAARASGALVRREWCVQRGDRLRLHATLERASGYSPPGDPAELVRFVPRDDLGAIRLEEVLSRSPS